MRTQIAATLAEHEAERAAHEKEMSMLRDEAEEKIAELRRQLDGGHSKGVIGQVGVATAGGTGVGSTHGGRAAVVAVDGQELITLSRAALYRAAAIGLVLALLAGALLPRLLLGAGGEAATVFSEDGASGEAAGPE